MSIAYRAVFSVRLAEILALDGRLEEARASFERAIEEFERKGNVAALRRARTLLEEFDPAV